MTDERRELAASLRATYFFHASGASTPLVSRTTFDALPKVDQDRWFAVADEVTAKLAAAWDRGAATPRMQDGSDEPVGDNPYRTDYTPRITKALRKAAQW